MVSLGCHNAYLGNTLGAGRSLHTMCYVDGSRQYSLQSLILSQDFGIVPLPDFSHKNTCQQTGIQLDAALAIWNSWNVVEKTDTAHGERKVHNGGGLVTSSWINDIMAYNIIFIIFLAFCDQLLPVVTSCCQMWPAVCLFVVARCDHELPDVALFLIGQARQGNTYQPLRECIARVSM